MNTDASDKNFFLCDLPVHCIPSADDPDTFVTSGLCEDICTVGNSHDTWFKCRHMREDGNELFHAGQSCPIRRTHVAKSALQSIRGGNAHPPMPENACSRMLRKLASDALCEIADTPEERAFYEGQTV